MNPPDFSGGGRRLELRSSLEYGGHSRPLIHPRSPHSLIFNGSVFEMYSFCENSGETSSSLGGRLSRSPLRASFASLSFAFPLWDSVVSVSLPSQNTLSCHLNPQLPVSGTDVRSRVAWRQGKYSLCSQVLSSEGSPKPCHRNPSVPMSSIRALFLHPGHAADAYLPAHPLPSHPSTVRQVCSHPIGL